MCWSRKQKIVGKIVEVITHKQQNEHQNMLGMYLQRHVGNVCSTSDSIISFVV